MQYYINVSIILKYTIRIAKHVFLLKNPKIKFEIYIQISNQNDHL